MLLAKLLGESLAMSKDIRIRLSRCPNDRGQVQATNNGLVGTTTGMDDKPIEGVRVFLRGKLGEDAHLGKEVAKSVPCYRTGQPVQLL